MHQRKKLVLTGAAATALAALAPASAIAATPDPASDPFVCPVLTLPSQAVDNSGKFGSIGNGEYTFGPGAAGSGETFNGNVPNLATNADGSGDPGGAHASPGDTDYTASPDNHPRG
jgi:hypothetical protein